MRPSEKAIEEKRQAETVSNALTVPAELGVNDIAQSEISPGSVAGRLFRPQPFEKRPGPLQEIRGWGTPSQELSAEIIELLQTLIDLVSSSDTRSQNSFLF